MKHRGTQPEKQKRKWRVEAFSGGFSIQVYVDSIVWLFVAISGPKQRWTKWRFQAVKRMLCTGEDTFVICRTSSQMTRASPFIARVSKTVHDSLVNGREELKEVSWTEIKDPWPSNPRATENISWNKVSFDTNFPLSICPMCIRSKQDLVSLSQRGHIRVGYPFGTHSAAPRWKAHRTQRNHMRHGKGQASGSEPGQGWEDESSSSPQRSRNKKLVFQCWLWKCKAWQKTLSWHRAKPSSIWVTIQVLAANLQQVLPANPQPSSTKWKTICLDWDLKRVNKSCQIQQERNTSVGLRCNFPLETLNFQSHQCHCGCLVGWQTYDPSYLQLILSARGELGSSGCMFLLILLSSAYPSIILWKHS